GRVAGAPGRAKVEPGCAMLRSIGAVVLGAVRVEGGGLKVCEPRLPELRPPPTRASASTATTLSAATTDINMRSGRSRRRKLVILPSVDPVPSRPPDSSGRRLRRTYWYGGMAF